MLLVEDDPATLQLFTRGLKLDGYAVIGAADAATAISAVRTRPPDAIVLDLRLPAMDGLQCLRQIRDITEIPIPAAIVTGDYFIEEGQVAALQTLGARVFYKPVWLTDLVAIVRGLLAAPE